MMFLYQRTGRIFWHWLIKTISRTFLVWGIVFAGTCGKKIVVIAGFRDELEIKSSTGTTDLGPLKSTHDEADLILVLHAVHKQIHTVVGSPRDTDVLLVLVSRITIISKYAISATLDEVRLIRRTAVYTHWCSVQQTAKRLRSIIVSISRVNWERNHLLHRKSHQAVIMEIYKEHHGLLKNLGIGELTEETIVLRNICLNSDGLWKVGMYLYQRTGRIFWHWLIQCAQIWLYRCSMARIVLEHGNPRSNGPNKWCAPFSLDESTRSSDDMKKCPLPHTWAPGALRNGTETWGIRTAVRTDVRLPVRAGNNARLVAANARNRDYDAHRCLHASIRLMIRRLAWIGIREDWLGWLKAVHAGESPKLWFGSHFIYAN